VHDNAFGSLIAPVTTADFFSRYFEREVLHVARDDAAAVAGLYAVGDVENALILGANEPEHFALIKTGEEALDTEAFTTARAVIRYRSARKSSRALVDPRAVLDAFARGYTLNIKDATAYHPPLAQLCSRIQAQLGAYAQVNVYFTPPRAQGFEIHYDTHDTLIVQIEGDKHWEVHAPVVPLPLEMQPFSAAAHVGKLDEPREYRLQAGDVLYIPHGFPHCAKTAERRSLHLTFAISPIRLIDLVDALVQLAALGDPALRAALPPGWHRDPTFSARTSAQLAALLPRAIAPERLPLAAELAFNDLFGATRTTAAHAFDTLAAFESLEPGTRIQLRDDTPFQLRDRGERLDIVLAGKVVTIPGLAREAFARLEAGPATFADLDRLVPQGLGKTFLRTLVLNELVVAGEPS
jgi:ribosomal protein L16 Arg81 hydroxylase